MECTEIRFSRHAVERMFQRGIPPEWVLGIVENGETIVSYPDDTPYPSLLLLGFQENRPIHAVVAKDADSGVCYVITVYQPAPDLWSADFKTRRQP